jgi:hypothetical protein
MNKSEPRLAFVLSLIGGIYTIVGTCILVALPFLVDAYRFYYYYFGYYIDLEKIIFATIYLPGIGLVLGIFVIMGSMFIKGRQTTLGGALVLAFSIPSLFFGLFFLSGILYYGKEVVITIFAVSMIISSAYFLGFIFGLIGAISALTWRPE